MPPGAHPPIARFGRRRIGNHGPMGYDVTQVQKSLSGFDYPGGPADLSKHAQDQGADQQLVDTLAGLDKQQFDGPNAVMKSLSEAGVLGGS